MSDRANEYWDKAMSAMSQPKRDYWLDRYETAVNKVYRRVPGKIRKIDDILRDCAEKKEVK